jgi:hypothetical protein
MLPQHFHDELPQLRKTMARMVFRALLDYVHNKKWANGKVPKTKRDRRCKDLFEETRAWIFDLPLPTDACGVLEIEGDFVSEAEARVILDSFERLMSFESACGILGWDPDWVRSRLPALTVEQLRRVGKKHGFV